MTHYQNLHLQASYAGYSSIEWRASNDCDGNPIDDILINVNPSPGPTVPPGTGITITNGNPPGGVVGVDYGFTFTESGGVLPVVWTVSDTLPPGLVLSQGVLSGTPTKEGLFTIIVTVTDAENNDDQATYIIPITRFAGTVLLPYFFRVNSCNSWQRPGEDAACL